jgi:hypothetical protein
MAPWAAAGGLMLLLGVVTLPFAGFRFFMGFLSERLPLYMLVGMILVGPFTYRYLR